MKTLVLIEMIFMGGIRSIRNIFLINVCTSIAWGFLVGTKINWICGIFLAMTLLWSALKHADNELMEVALNNMSSYTDRLTKLVLETTIDEDLRRVLTEVRKGLDKE